MSEDGILIGPTDPLATHVLIYESIFEWGAKGPFTESGHSVIGALEINLASGTIRCHECGQWFRQLPAHIRSNEGISLREYRRDHGLRMANPLRLPAMKPRQRRVTREVIAVSQSTAAQASNAQAIKALSTRSQDGNAGLVRAVNQDPRPIPSKEAENFYKRCRPQLTRDILFLAAKLGRVPTPCELRDNKIKPNTLRHAFGCSTYQGVLAEIGLAPKPRRSPTHLEEAITMRMYFGEDPAKIARDLAVSDTTVKSVIQKVG